MMQIGVRETLRVDVFVVLFIIRVGKSITISTDIA